MFPSRRDLQKHTLLGLCTEAPTATSSCQNLCRYTACSSSVTAHSPGSRSVLLHLPSHPICSDQVSGFPTSLPQGPPEQLTETEAVNTAVGVATRKHFLERARNKSFCRYSQNKRENPFPGLVLMKSNKMECNHICRVQVYIMRDWNFF